MRAREELRTAAIAVAMALSMAGLWGCGGGGGSSSPPTTSPGSPPAPPVVPPPTMPPPAPPPPPSPSGPPATSGPTYHFSDCQTGAASGCVPGDDANAGTTSSAPKRTLTALFLNTLPAGARVLLAEGGAWANVALTIDNKNVTPSQPLVISSYSTVWGGSARPRLAGGATFFVFQFGAFGDLGLDGGYYLHNLRLVGRRNGDWGVHLRNNVQDVTLDSLEISDFDIGIHYSNNSQRADGSLDTTTRVSRLTVKGSNIHDNLDQGILGDGYDTVLENNRIERNNSNATTFGHGVYMGGHGERLTVRNNVFVNNSVVPDPMSPSFGRCTGGNLTVHGQWDGILIEGNTIEQTASNIGCWGMSIDPGYNNEAEFFRNVVVRGNTLVNVGGNGLAIAAAPNIIIENNFFLHDQADFFSAVTIPAVTPGPLDDLDTGATVRNNTIVIARGSAGSEGISFRAGSGADLTAVSNLIVFGAATSSINHRCFTHQGTLTLRAVDHNLCFSAATGGFRWSNVFATRLDAAAAGFDGRGLTVDPQFESAPTPTNRSDLPSAGSPAVNAGDPARSSATDRLGRTRSAPDIGSRER